ILMDSGNMVMRGPVHEVVQRYATAAETTLGQFETASRSGTGWARVCSLELIGEGQQPVATRPADRDLVFRVNVTLTCARSKGMSLQGLVLELMFYSEEGHPLFSVMNVDDGGLSLPEAENCTIWMCLPVLTFV